jgi:signal transduction histidine kinase/response regulator of citrate/malate metabolism
MNPTPLQRKIFVLVVSLLTLVFIFTLFSVYNAAYNQAQGAFSKRLNVGRNVFFNEINVAKDHLDSSVETIAKDWALRRAVGQGVDTESINSILFNHGSRIKADIAYILDNDNVLIARYGTKEDVDRNIIVQHLEENHKTKAWITMLGDAPYLMSAEPITAPAQIGWLVMGRKISMGLLQRIKALISLDISVVVYTQNKDQLALTTNVNIENVKESFKQAPVPLNEREEKIFTLPLGEDSVVVMPFTLFTEQQMQFVVILQDSISASLSPLNKFLIELIPFFIIGLLLSVLGSFYLARSITKPVGKLLKAVKLVAGGKYTEDIHVSDKGELGELAREFRSMKNSVMEREQKILIQSKELAESHKIKFKANIAHKEKLLAEEATAAKSRFLANISHEIRTPLNSIIGYSEMLNDEGVDSQDRTRASKAINAGGKHLLSIVNDVLDVSKIEASKIELEELDTCLVSLLAEVSSYVDEPASKKGLEFRINWNFPLPSLFITDPTRLKQILINLCNNAVKFTLQGHIDLSVSLDQKKKRFIFVISDTGTGITEDQLSKLFSAYTQADQATTRKFGGTGLGLYISKELVQLMGGHIKVTSQVGVGSQFAVYLPWITSADAIFINNELEAEQVLEQSTQPNLTVPALDANILCADDNEDNRHLISYLVNKTGAKLTLAENGAQALTFANNNEFDLILMDMQMPVMDGIEATIGLKSSGYSKPIIMLTANNDNLSRQQIQESGADGHFAKPIDTQKFYDMLSNILPPKPVSISEDTPSSSAFDKLVAGYASRLPQKLANLSTAFEKQNWDELRQLIHKLKGSAGSYGFSDISEICENIEFQINEEDYKKAEQEFKQLNRAVKNASAPNLRVVNS